MWDDFLFRLRARRLRAVFEATHEGTAPSFAGAAWRGAMGAALREASCSTGARTCDGCPVAQSCTYGYVFETPVPADARRLRLYPNAPHPFVLRVASRGGADGARFEAGQRVLVELSLFGHGTDAEGAMIEALAVAGERGIGPERVPLRLVAVETLAGARQASRDLSAALARDDRSEPQPNGLPVDRGFLADHLPQAAGASAEVTLRFLSPARIVHGGALARSLPLHVVVRSLLRRVSSLASFHAGVELTVDFAGLVLRAQAVETSSERLDWCDQWRRSARQGAAHALGGLVGEVTYADVPPELVRLLEIGALVHVGKGVSFGLGHYECEVAPRSAATKGPRPAAQDAHFLARSRSAAASIDPSLSFGGER